jgi:hypothetical protein
LSQRKNLGTVPHGTRFRGSVSQARELARVALYLAIPIASSNARRTSGGWP